MQATRGRDTNVLFLVTQYSHDDHQTGETAHAARRDAADVLADVIRPPEVDPNRTALTEAETDAENQRATATHTDPLVAVIADVTAGRTQRWLDELAAAGHLPEQHRVALAADEARAALDQLLRTVELAGHDPAQALADAVIAGTLDGSTSVAQVLHYRLRRAHDNELTPRIARYADLLPAHLPDHTRDALLGLRGRRGRTTGRARGAARGRPAAVGAGSARPGPRHRPEPGSPGGVGGAGRVGRVLPGVGRTRRPTRRVGRRPGPRTGRATRRIPRRPPRPRVAGGRRGRRRHVRRQAARAVGGVAARTGHRTAVCRRRARRHPRRTTHRAGERHRLASPRRHRNRPVAARRARCGGRAGPRRGCSAGPAG